jgi:hypothetical protein
MKLGTLPRGLAVAAISAVTVVPLAASAAGAAPKAPTAYALFGSAKPLAWGSSSSVPVGELHVPAVIGRTDNLAAGRAKASLIAPDDRTELMSGEEIAGLQCQGYDEKACKDPFTPIAQANHNGPDAAHIEQSASFGGKDGKFPGSIHAMTDCAGNCGDQLVRSLGEASGPAGALGTYVSVGASSARQELSIDDRGRLVSTAVSRLDNVSIGPKSEIHFSNLTTTSQAFGSGAENSKDGRADLRISDFYILDSPVELTRAGLRLANGGPSEQEAYDGAKVLLQKLRDRGIRLELPNFDTQITKTPAHAAVAVDGLKVFFEQAAGPVNASALTYPLELGHSTAVVAALDTDKNIVVNENPNGGVTIQTSAPPVDAANPPPVTNPPPTARNPKGGPNPQGGVTKDGKEVAPGPKTSTTQPSATPNSTGELPEPPAQITTTTPTSDSGAQATNPDDVALPSLDDLQRKLGLRGAHSVSNAFGAFLGLGLILPVARFLIRRLG